MLTKRYPRWFYVVWGAEPLESRFSRSFLNLISSTPLPVRQKHLLIVVVAAFVGCVTDLISGDCPVQLIGSVTEQDQALPNDEDSHRNLRRYTATEKESSDSEMEERAGLQWLSKLKTRFGGNSNVAKSLEKNSELAMALHKNPQVVKQIEDLQKKPELIKRIANNPAMEKLTGRLAKNPVKFNEQNVKNIGRLAAKITTRGGESFGGNRIYLALGIFVLLVFFIGGPALIIARKSG